VRGWPGIRGCARAALACGALALTGCGGGTPQDAHEKSGTYTLDILNASFPTEQRLADRTTLSITVRNADDKRVPDVAVTVEGAEASAPAAAFAESNSQPGLADPSRPVWILDEGPRGGDTAYTNTWALGPLDRGQTKTFVWHVTAVKPGVHTIRYRVAAGLNGKAKAKLASGDEPKGTFTINIANAPANAKVADNGKVAKGVPSYNTPGARQPAENVPSP
jgi:hypothetical protein